MADPSDRLSSNKEAFRFALVQEMGATGLGAMNPWSLVFLRDMIEAHTDFQAEPVDGGAAISFADCRLPSIPILFIADLRKTVNLAHLVPHLATGGFFIGEAAGPSKEIPWSGNAISTAPLAPEHPIFSSYYDLKQGIPAPVSRSSVTKTSRWGPLLKFTGYFLEGRLVGVSSEPSLSWRQYWNAPDYKDLPVEIKLVINMMVYARLQKPAEIEDDNPASIKK